MIISLFSFLRKSFSTFDIVTYLFTLLLSYGTTKATKRQLKKKNLNLHYTNDIMETTSTSHTLILIQFTKENEKKKYIKLRTYNLYTYQLIYILD